MKVSLRKRAGWVICVRNGSYKAALEVRKVYRAIPDAKAAAHDYVRIIDESGEDYLYPEVFFLPLELSRPVKKALLRAS